MRRLLLALATAVLAVAPLACGSGRSEDAAPPPPPPPEDTSSHQVVAAAASKTSAAATAKARFTVAMTGVAAEPVEMVGEGAFDSKNRRGRMTFDLSTLGAAAGGQDLGEMELVFDELVVYMRWPFLQGLTPGVRTWVKLDLQALGRRHGFDLGRLSQLQQGDPSQALVYLRAASKDVKKLGEEEVRGVATTRYRMTVQLDEVAQVAPPDQRARVKAAIAEIAGKSGIREVPVEVWIDEDGLVRRQKLEYRDMRVGAGATADMTTTMELYGFGADVDVRIPPARQVTHFTELVGDAGAGSRRR